MKKTNSRALQFPARALVVMNHPLLTEIIRLVLNHGVYASRAVRDGEAAAMIMDEWQPHLAIVDLDANTSNMVGRLGFERGRDDYIPVIGLTRRDNLGSTLAAFESGVDDVLTLPFSPEELVARALVVTRRHYGNAAVLNPVIRFGELEIDILERCVHVGTAQLRLNSLEESVLYLLVANAGQPLSREEILDNLWGAEYAPESMVVDHLVHTLRTKLYAHSHRRFIETVPRKGYCFVAALSEDQEAAAAV